MDQSRTDTWMDLTLRVASDCEVDVQPADNTFELSWSLPEGSRATILVSPDAARRLHERIGGLLMMIPGSAPA